ncbi:DUF2513 domain-containing protein [Agarivorans sp. Alg241-V36]|uniref:DUF2513 domain-containing protein n=1 Tax=Agarivorans sp. Alg241-V36 TaxID=2305992 RepID=UPI0013D722BB|nr:DUF2513 domain-containing protein [Agarivorans sp. Alg241-V36]
MKIDYDYIASILNVFLESNTAHLTIFDIKDSGIDIGDEFIDEKFLFHVQLLIDNELISNQHGLRDGLLTAGIRLNGNRSVILVKNNIRLTQKGHDFSKSLQNKEVMAKIKNELKDAPFKTVFDGGQKLLAHYAKKKLDEIMGSD